MINAEYIADWHNTAPWPTNEQVEQDLLICRCLVAIYNDEFLASQLAFRGGTALHKLFFHRIGRGRRHERQRGVGEIGLTRRPGMFRPAVSSGRRGRSNCFCRRR